MLGQYAIVDIVMLAFVVIITLTYTFRGFLKSVVQLVKTALAFAAAYLLGGRVGDFLCQRYFGAAVRNFVFDKVNGMYTGAADSLNLDSVTAQIPEFMLTEEVKNGITAAEGTGEQLINSVTDAIATPTANTLSGVIGYVGVFLVTLIVLSIVACFLNAIIDKIKIFKLANTLLGALFGLVISFLVLCVFSSAVKALMGETDFYLSSKLMKFLGDSAFLEKIKFLDVHQFIQK